VTVEPIVYLTCEIKGRDLDSRALIAAHLVKRGYTVVLGQYWNLKDRAPVAPRGCYLFKTANQIQADGMSVCKMHGHDVVASDEESLSVSESVAAELTVPATFDSCDLYLALTPAHERALHKAIPASKGRVRVTGTARADILRHTRFERPHAAPYVLFNTSFGWINSVWGSVIHAINNYSRGTQRDLDTPEDQALIRARVDYETAALKETRALLDWFIARADIDIILRPHPNENVKWWHKHYGRHARLRVVENTDPYPWIQHAALLIHSDSTTGVEATVMGVPCLNISPHDAWARRLILRDINHSVAAAGDAYGAIERFLARGDGPIAEARSRDPFPKECAAASAEAISSLLPPARPMGPFPWTPTPRQEIHQKKFTVSPEEFAESLGRAFKMAGYETYAVEPLADSVVKVSPRAG
jgi:surface carbohydrate biosynthesis protein